MGTQTNLIIRDDTGANVTFRPVSDRPILAWRTNVAGVTEAGQLRIEQQSEILKSGKRRTNLKIVQPIMAVIPDGSVNAMGYQAGPTVVDEDAVSVTFYAGSRGTDITRANLVRMLVHLLSGAGETMDMGYNATGTDAGVFSSLVEGAVVPYGLVSNFWPN